MQTDTVTLGGRRSCKGATDEIAEQEEVLNPSYLDGLRGKDRSIMYILE